MHIKLVKKIKLDGNPCRKSARVLSEIEKLDLLDKIDEIIAADERQPSSEGFTLARKYQVAAAPFFIVENESGLTRVYTAYHRFMKDIFQISVSEEEEIFEIMAQNPELDYI
ncbi:MAG: hypothetical protein QNJ63_22250 [Calothrix sp. MO_192.B10]|nr:hypothetical protein [Calothrix sp. MO_192.B10]